MRVAPVDFKKNNDLLDRLGLFFIAIVSFLYALFNSRFAELHISLNFLNFPVFIGELLLIFCLILLALKYLLNHREFKLTKGICLTACYFIFVLAKALSGYLIWGPLAFRHAALFYYPLFAIITYSFFTKKVFGGKEIIFYILLCSIAVKFAGLYVYFALTSFLLSLICIMACRHTVLKYILFLMLLIIMPYSSLLITSRTMLLGNVLSILFIIVCLLWVSRIKTKYKVYISIASLALLFAIILIKSDKNDLRSLYDLKGFIYFYEKFRISIDSRKDSFKMQQIDSVKLYAPEKPANVAIDVQKNIKKPIFDKANGTFFPIWPDLPGRLVATANYKREPTIQPAPTDRPAIQIPIAIRLDLDQNCKILTRDIDHAFACSMFRLLIWEDVLAQMKEHKERIFFGFDFGKPFRSKNIEILDIAANDWKKDGWLSIHNGYLDIFYRAGIVGLLTILFIFTLLIKMIVIFLKHRSISGILLCGVLVNWLVAANFLEILELPYTAIPFWSIFGITFACAKSFINENHPAGTKNG